VIFVIRANNLRTRNLIDTIFIRHSPVTYRNSFSIGLVARHGWLAGWASLCRQKSQERVSA
jgi:hypothetical protein